MSWVSVDNTPYGLDYLMVSRFPTDVRMPTRRPFENRDFNESPSRDLPTAITTGAKAGDLFTVRASLNAAASFGDGVRCRDVRFRLRVLRGGVAVTFSPGDGQPPGQAYYEYPAVNGSNASGECRAEKYVRFVSNAPPGSAGADGSPGAVNPGGGVYDDEFNGKQTVRVELGDSVEIWAVATVSGAPVESDKLPLPIGRENAPLSDPDTQSEVAVHWAAPSGAASEPGVTIDRMSEDFAQAAIRFRQDGATAAYDEVQNTFRLQILAPAGQTLAGWTSTAGGTVEAQVVMDQGAASFTASHTYVAGARLRYVSRHSFGRSCAPTPCLY